MMLPKSIQGLYDFMRCITDDGYDVRNLKLLEIGSLAGTSSGIFADKFKEVVCVDCWENIKGTITEILDMKEVENRFDKIANEYKNIIKIKNRIENVIDTFKNKEFDVIYHDGNHKYDTLKKELKMLLPKCKLYIAGHDYNIHKFAGVVNAVNETTGKPDRIFCDTSWIYKIR